MIRLETFIRDAFVNREHVVSVFFDLEKAHDTTWRYGILKDLHDLGLRGRLPVFIRSFLEDRTMQVRVGSTLSDFYDKERKMTSWVEASLNFTHLEYRAVGWIFSSAFKTIHTLNIEVWVRHSAMHSKTYILNIELWDQDPLLNSKPYTL